MERKAKCNNVGVCSLANKIQVITDDDAELICPECGEELELVKDVPPPPPTSPWRKIAAIGAGVVVAAGIGYWAWPSGKTEPSTGPDTTVVDTAKTDTTKIDTVKAAPKVDPNPESKAEPEQKPKETTSKKAASKPWASYASFDGTTMTFRKAHVIPGTSKMAQPGDKVSGLWVDGEVNSVRWYHADGSPSEQLVHD